MDLCDMCKWHSKYTDIHCAECCHNPNFCGLIALIYAQDFFEKKEKDVKDESNC